MGNMFVLVFQVGVFMQCIGFDLFDFGVQVFDFVVDVGGGSCIGGILLGFDIWLFVVYVWVFGGYFLFLFILVWVGCCVLSVGCFWCVFGW